MSSDQQFIVVMACLSLVVGLALLLAAKSIWFPGLDDDGESSSSSESSTSALPEPTEPLPRAKMPKHGYDRKTGDDRTGMKYKTKKRKQCRQK